MRIIIKNFLILFFSSFLLLGIIFFLWLSFLKIPNIESLKNIKKISSSKIYDRTGKIILYDFFNEEKRTFIKNNEISPNIKNAVLAIEDANFYNHPGIDVRSIFRALISNIKEGNYGQGGSTITQQTVKNLILTKEKSISRKLKEIILSFKIEKKLTKDEILNLYLNQIAFVGNVYGVEEASKTFFNKKARDINLVEASYLAATIKAPGFFSPYGQNLQKLEERKNLVLYRMFQEGLINKEKLLEAQKEKIIFEKKKQTINAPHFVFYLRDYLNKILEKNWEYSGYKIISTIDLRIQEEGEKIALKYALKNQENFNIKNTSFVALDHSNGQILSLIGSRDYFDKEIDGQFNITTALRRPGSIFKTFVYSKALEKGLTPDTIIFDTKTEFSKYCNYESIIKEKYRRNDKLWEEKVNLFKKILILNKFTIKEDEKIEKILFKINQELKITIKEEDVNIFKDYFNFEKEKNKIKENEELGEDDKIIQIENLEIKIRINEFKKILLGDRCYSPSNFNNKYIGPLKLKTAFASSINIPAVKTAYLVGEKEIIKLGQRLGLKNLDLNKDYGLSIALGGGEVSLLNTTNAYGTIANLGIKNKVTPIIKIYKNKKIIYEEKNKKSNVYDKNHSLTIIDILKDKKNKYLTYGINSPLYFNDKDVFVKTGTSNDYKDLLTIGCSTKVCLGAWAGNNEEIIIERGVISGLIVSPMWREYFDNISEYYPGGKFEKYNEKKYEKNKNVISGFWFFENNKVFYNRFKELISFGFRPHNILFYLEKNNLNKLNKIKEKEPQFNNWEYSVQKWFFKNYLEEKPFIFVFLEKDNLNKYFLEIFSNIKHTEEFIFVNGIKIEPIKKNQLKYNFMSSRKFELKIEIFDINQEILFRENKLFDFN